MVAPSATELLVDPIVQRAFAAAWADSFPDDPQLRHEEGGFIYYNPTKGLIAIRRTPPGERGSINLTWPPVIPGALLVATYHTHPTPPGGRVTAEPSGQDKRFEKESGVPWFVISHVGNFATGPDSRAGGLTGSPTYPDD